MSDNKISAKAAAADRFIAEYSEAISSFEKNMKNQVNDMYSVINSLFTSWTGDLARGYQNKIENNLEAIVHSCDRCDKLHRVLEVRAQQIRDHLDKLKRATENN